MKNEMEKIVLVGSEFDGTEYNVNRSSNSLQLSRLNGKWYNYKGSAITSHDRWLYKRIGNTNHFAFTSIEYGEGVEVEGLISNKVVWLG